MASTSAYHVVGTESCEVTTIDGDLEDGGVVYSPGPDSEQTSSGVCGLKRRMPAGLSTCIRKQRRTVMLLAALCLLLTMAYGWMLLVPIQDDSLNPLLEFCLWRLDLSDAEAQCLQYPRSEFVVSMTTLPRRLAHIDRTLKTLLLQSRCPRQIFVWVPTLNEREGGTEYVIPESMLELNRTSQIIRIMRVPIDYGPATKFIPALQHFARVEPNPDQGIVVLDDDVLYPRDLLQKYDCFAHQLPDAALTAWGCHTSGTPHTYCARGSELTYPIESDLVFGTASFFLRAGWLDADDMANFEGAPIEHAKFEDDWYVSGALARAGRTAYVIPVSHRQLVQSDTMLFERGSLMNTDNDDNQHFHAMMQWYTTDILHGGSKAELAKPHPTKVARTDEEERQHRDEMSRVCNGANDDFFADAAAPTRTRHCM